MVKTAGNSEAGRDGLAVFAERVWSMRKSSPSLIAAALALGIAAPAEAADYDPLPVYRDAPQYAPVEVGSGWYLRGDVGYNASTNPRGDFTYRTFNAGAYSDHTATSADLSDEFTFGLGVGYSFTDMLRGDVTVSRLSSDFSGSGPCNAALGPDCRTVGESELTAYAALANAYVDLGTFVGFTPYVGAGAGFTYVNWDDMQSSNYCGGVPCAANPGATHPGESDWRFTYALMAGVAYDLSENMKLDLGYRYMKVKDGDMFGWDADSAAEGARGMQGRDPGLSTHEVRLGLRFELW